MRVEAQLLADGGQRGPRERNGDQHRSAQLENRQTPVKHRALLIRANRRYSSSQIGMSDSSSS